VDALGDLEFVIHQNMYGAGVEHEQAHASQQTYSPRATRLAQHGDLAEEVA
jgi:hypothetical protein